MKRIAFDAGDDMAAQLEAFAKAQSLPLDEYMRAVVTMHVYEKLRMQRDFERAEALVGARGG